MTCLRQRPRGRRASAIQMVTRGRDGGISMSRTMDSSEHTLRRGARRRKTVYWRIEYAVSLHQFLFRSRRTWHQAVNWRWMAASETSREGAASGATPSKIGTWARRRGGAWIHAYSSSAQPSHHHAAAHNGGRLRRDLQRVHLSTHLSLPMLLVRRAEHMR